MDNLLYGFLNGRVDGCIFSMKKINFKKYLHEKFKLKFNFKK